MPTRTMYPGFWRPFVAHEGGATLRRLPLAGNADGVWKKTI